MNMHFAFWDASAIIPLCVWQKQTALASLHYTRYGIAVWWATPIEIIRGLTRLESMNAIGHDHFLAGTQRVQSLSKFWDAVGPSPAIAARACTLRKSYTLRAADALQLAAALEYFEDTPKGHTFIVSDQRLADAALQSGFLVESI
jgi:predicted nucleic acid-binding protein